VIDVKTTNYYFKIGPNEVDIYYCNYLIRAMDGGWGGGGENPLNQPTDCIQSTSFLTLVFLRHLFLVKVTTVFNHVLIPIPRQVYSKTVNGSVTHFILPPTDLFSHCDLKKKFVSQQDLPNGLA
jgi:hypothetical protein